MIQKQHFFDDRVKFGQVVLISKFRNHHSHGLSNLQIEFSINKIIRMREMFSDYNQE